MKRRTGTKFIFAEDDSNPKVVSICEFKGKLYVATQKGLYVLKENGIFVRLEICESSTTITKSLSARDICNEALRKIKA